MTRAKRHRPRSPTARTLAGDTPPPPAPIEVMTIEQLATYLSLAVHTLYKKVQAREIPFTKVGNLLRFTRVSIDQWLARNTTMPDDSLYHRFARLQNRHHFQMWLEGRGVDWRKLTDGVFHPPLAPVANRYSLIPTRYGCSAPDMESALRGPRLLPEKPAVSRVYRRWEPAGHRAWPSADAKTGSGG